jgi:hypothetical protein
MMGYSNMGYIIGTIILLFKVNLTGTDRCPPAGLKDTHEHYEDISVYRNKPAGATGFGAREYATTIQC